MQSERNERNAQAWHRTVNRRQLLRVGGLGSLGLTLPALLRAEADSVRRQTGSRAASGHAADPFVHLDLSLWRA